jgi:sulfite oxidase
LKAAAAGAAVGVLGRERIVWGAENDLIVRSPEPYNAEPLLNLLAAAHLTPARHFYVRNHGTQPKVDANGYKLHVEGLVQSPGEVSLGALKDRYAQLATEATLTCAGNRRQEMSAIKPVGGVQWDAGAIGNARWTGVKLADVLKAAEIKSEAKHVWFEGLDAIQEKDGSAAPFGGSISLDKALASDAPALVAHAMNNQPLTAEHGAPLRTVVPGYIGARSVKWLTKITLSDRPSPNHFLTEAYKLVQTDDKSEVAAADPIYAFSVNVAICQPPAQTKLNPRRLSLSGYALPSGDGSTMDRVEVSADGGRTWTRARLEGENRPYTWQLWSAELELRPGKYDLVARATDSSGKSTPERGAWNLKGYLYNGWHHVPVEITS